MIVRLLLLFALFELLCFCQTPPSVNKHKRSIFNILECQDRFSKLVRALSNFPEIVGALKGGETALTIFAPDNKAFEKLHEIPQGQELENMLRYHIASEVIKLDDSLERQIFPTLLAEPVLGGAQRLKVQMQDKHAYVNDKDKVTEANIEASNGMVHVISDVLFQPPDLLHRIAEDPTKASILIDAFELTDSTDILRSQRLTVFAPINAAFEHLSKHERHELFSREGVKNLTSILRRHVVPALLYLGELEQNEVKLNTLEEGVVLVVRKHKKGFLVNGVPVKTNDVFGNNGVVNYMPEIVPEKEPSQDSASLTSDSLFQSLRSWASDLFSYLTHKE